MSDWLSDVIGNDLIAVYEGLYFTEDALAMAPGKASHLWRVARGGDRLVAVDGCQHR